VAKIDDTSDDLRRRLAELARNRASLLEAVKKDAPPLSDQQALADYNKEQEMIQEYHRWARSVASQYNLEVRVERRNP